MNIKKVALTLASVAAITRLRQKHLLFQLLRVKSVWHVLPVTTNTSQF
jgi:hypothetical protein